MNKNTKICLIAAGLMVLCFLISCLMDVSKYSQSGSAPCWVYLLVRAIEFLVPAILLCGLGLWYSRKKKHTQS